MTPVRSPAPSPVADAGPDRVDAALPAAAARPAARRSACSAAAPGCATALAVQPDDTVTGEIVVATPEKSPDDKGPTITLPPELADDVDVARVPQDGYTGSVLRFSEPDLRAGRRS